MTRHFIKTVVVFTLLIILGLIGVIAVSVFADEENAYKDAVLNSFGICKISEMC